MREMRSSNNAVNLNRRRLIAGTGAALAVAVGRGFYGREADAAAVPLYHRCSFGTYADNEPWPDLGAHFALERLTGARLGRMTWFQDFGSGWLGAQASAAGKAGRDIVISWEPSANSRPIQFADILAGYWDAALAAFFRNAKLYPGKVIIRPFWEMNANAARYSMNYSGSDRQVSSISQFRDTWRKIVNVQRAVGGSNIKWFFCANGSDVGRYRMEDYYPGSQYVDEVGFDTYNDDWSPWTDFEPKIAPMYNRLTTMNVAAPVSIGEIGCKEYGAPAGESKATWTRKMFLSAQYPRLKNVSFFNAVRGVDWRLNSSAASLAIFQRYLPWAPGGSMATSPSISLIPATQRS